jgi:inosose dehydratase
VVTYAETSGGIAGDRSRRLSSRPRLPSGKWVAFGRKLTGLADALARCGLRLAYRHHMGTVVGSEDDIDLLMETSGEPVGLLLDTGHLVFTGADPAAVARRLARRFSHVHCKDVRPEVLAAVRARDASFLDAVLDGVFTVPGDGGMQLQEVAVPRRNPTSQPW